MQGDGDGDGVLFGDWVGAASGEGDADGMGDTFAVAVGDGKVIAFSVVLPKHNGTDVG